LFRFREVKKDDLLLGSDPRADEIKKMMERVKRAMVKEEARITQLEQKMKIIEEILKWLEGHGSADLLRQVDQLSDS
jgi:hypothetical protein